MKSLFGTLACLIAVGLSNFSFAQQSWNSISWNSFAVQIEPNSQIQKSPVVTGVSLQSNGHLVAIVGDDHVVNIYDRSTSQFVSKLDAHVDWVRTAQFSPDGSHLATAGNDRQILLWNSADLATPQTTIQHPEAIVAVAYSPDGAHIAAVGFEQSMRIYSTADGQLVRELACPCVDMRTVAFSSDSELVAAGGRNGVIKIWNVETGNEIAKQQVHQQRIRQLLFLEDNRVVSCSEDRQIKISDIINQGPSQTLPQQAGKLFSLALLHDDMLATGGTDNHITIWNLADFSEIGKLSGHSGTVSCLDYHDGVLISGSYDTHVRFWTTEKTASSDNDFFRR